MKNFTGYFLPLSLLVIIPLMVAGCGSTGKVEEPLPTMATGGVVANGPAGTTGTINDVTPVPVPEEKQDPRPTVPRVKQAQIIGVVHELVQSGCLIKKIASTDGIHYSQLVVTCGDAQEAPAVE